MRNILFLFLFLLSLGFTHSKNIIMEKNKLDGKWVPIMLEINGNSLPEATFKNQQLIISDSTYIFIAESTDKGLVKYTDDKIDIYGKEDVNAGKHFTAIYKMENELLTICYNLAGDQYPEAFETKGKPSYFLAVFKKEETK